MLREAEPRPVVNAAYTPVNQTDLVVLHLVVGTGGVYGRRAKNLLLTILRLAPRRKELKVVYDQRGALASWGRTLAEAIAKIPVQSKRDFSRLLRRTGGLYQLTTGEQTSWYGFFFVKKAIVEVDPNRAEEILEGSKPIPTSEYPTPAGDLPTRHQRTRS